MNIRFGLFLFVCMLALASCGGGSNGKPDTDGDGVIDENDHFVNDPNESVDSDGDGVGDNGDAFPNDASESADSDGDSVGNNSDNCPQNANNDQHDADMDGFGDACELSYVFADTGSNDTVSYSGQTARHMLIDGLDAAIANLQRGDPRTQQQVINQDLNLYYQNYDADTDTENALDTIAIEYSLKNDDVGILITNTDTPADLSLGSISGTKNLDGKIAGSDKCFHILIDAGISAACADGERGEFFGWEDGLDSDLLVRTPEDLLQYFFNQIAAESTSDALPLIDTLENDATAINIATVSASGRDYQQLVQKFLLGAVTFSQGSADYLQSDFGSADMLSVDEGKVYTKGQHHWDEAFGYYGSARNAAHYTDLEARAKSGRDEFLNGYNDFTGDNLINIRSEVMLGNATNCAKRDAGASVKTTLSEEVFDAFLAGRQILQDAGDAGELTAAQAEALNGHVVNASLAWEKCIAATVVHYINDVLADMADYSEGQFQDLAHFTDLAKHWSEMKGFALGLQFSPSSPFRSAGSGVNIDDLKTVLSLMGDAPVLADGTQMGEAYVGGSLSYQADLLSAREILEDAYSFNAENTLNW